MPDIKIINIRSGESLIGSCTTTDDTITIDKPCNIQIQPVQDPSNPGGPPVAGIAMIPYMPFIKDSTFTFKISELNWGPKEPQDEIGQDYKTKVLGSKIQSARASDMPPPGAKPGLIT